MNRQIAFLQTIHESPADDSLRLIFADWLEENGEPERAEFVRAQVELEGMSDRDPRRVTLRRKEKELLSEHRSAWLGPLSHLESGARGADRGRSRTVPDARFSFVRGMLQVRLGPDARPAMELLEAPQWDWVEELRWLSGWRAANVSHFLTSSRLARCTALTLHGIRSSRSSGKEVAALVASPLLARITALDLCLNQIDGKTAAVLAASPHLSGLSVLGLTFNKIGDEGAVALAASPYLGRLTALELRANKIGAEGAAALAASPQLAELNTLDFRENEIGRRARATHALRGRFGDRLKL